MGRIKLYVYFCLVIFLASCSSPKEVAKLDENIFFEEEAAEFEKTANLEDEFNLEGSDGEAGEFEEFGFDEEDASSKVEDSFGEDVASSEIDSEFKDDVSEEDLESAEVTEESEVDFGDFEEDVAAVGENSVLKKDQIDEPVDEFSESADLSLGEDIDFEEESFETPQSGTADLSEEPVGFGENQVLSVDYKAYQNGGAFVIKTSQSPEVQTEYISETNQYILKFKNSKISKNLARPFLTKDFKQSFEGMNSYQDSDGNSKFVFKLKTGSYPKIKRVANGIVLESGADQLLPSDMKTAEVVTGDSNLEDFLLEKKKYVGEKISIQAKDEDIVNVINFISEQVGVNLVVSSAVTGKISIKLKDIPWDQALVTVMKAKGLGYIRSENVLRVAPLDELRRETILVEEIKRSKKKLAEYFVKVFPLSYAKPEVLAGKVKSFLTVRTDGSGGGGSVISEARSSSLIVRDTIEVIENIASLIKELDQPPLQVMIETKIIEAQKNFSQVLEKTFSISPSSRSAGGGLGFSSPIGFSEDFTANLQVSGINFFGNLGHTLRLNEINSKVKVLSSPRVMAVNNTKATIVQSDQILNEVITTSGTEGIATRSIERTEAELRLEVTPQVSADGGVIMDIFIKREFPNAEVFNTFAISKREARTKVVVGNNKTAMIGGVYQTVENKTDSGTPILRKVPLLKWFFSDKKRRKSDSELIIFLTPRVINKFPHKSFARGKGLPSSGDKVSKF